MLREHTTKPSADNHLWQQFQAYKKETFKIFLSLILIGSCQIVQASSEQLPIAQPTIPSSTTPQQNAAQQQEQLQQQQPAVTPQQNAAQQQRIQQDQADQQQTQQQQLQQDIQQTQ